MPFTQAFVHLVWATKNRVPVLDHGIEPVAHRAIRSVAFELGGHVYAVNGMPDHVHLVSTLPVTLSLAKYVGQIKAHSSRMIRRGCLDAFAWQSEYGAFTFGVWDLDRLTAYVEHQKVHHAQAATAPDLERTGNTSFSSLRSRRQE